MDTKSGTAFWWVKAAKKDEESNLIVPQLDLDISSSLADFLDKEQNLLSSGRHDYGDVGSIIDEINRVAAQSPLGPYDRSMSEERSIDDIMKEAEKIYLESSKSFEQLSQRSKTSQNITELQSKDSTPTPKSISPLPIDGEGVGTDNTYSEDFGSNSESDEEYSKIQSIPSPSNGNCHSFPTEPEAQLEGVDERVAPPDLEGNIDTKASGDYFDTSKLDNQPFLEKSKLLKEAEVKEGIIRSLEEDNKQLREEFRVVKAECEQNSILLEHTKLALNAKSLRSPEVNIELEKTLEDLKDTREINTALQLQLDSINKTHQLLKGSYDDLLNSNKHLDRKVAEFDQTLIKYKNELVNVQCQKDKLLENEINLNKLLEIEKLQAKSLKLQNEKDARCIQDLNRQIKEMERIIARKHPDSVSALIVAAKNDAADQNLTARKLLEDRIRTLEEEAANRDSQSSRVFLDIQEKFNQMKLKYESHIEDLELHVNDLKEQLKRTVDTYDVYTQTIAGNEKIPHKDTATTSIQTDPMPMNRAPKIVVKRTEKNFDGKEDAHLLATIRGLQADLTNKEKVIGKLQKELDELRKTNRRLQKEREGSLRSLTEKREFRSYPEKLTMMQNGGSTLDVDEEIRQLKVERDKMKQQLYRMEEDYQALKTKRLHDLNALQEAHEHEISTYVSNVTPLREQMELQQVTILSLQSQLSSVKEELAVITVERDHLAQILPDTSSTTNVEIEALLKKIAFLEKRYEEREFRLRAIVQGLAQKSVMNRTCEQCAERQQQLIGYKVELDQLLASVRALK